jgi:hypothetical protein
VASARLNAIREELIVEVKETLDFNLENLKVKMQTLPSTQATDFHAIFRHFCFTLFLEERLYLISIDHFLSQDQIGMIQTLVTTNIYEMKQLTYIDLKVLHLQFFKEWNPDYKVRLKTTQFNLIKLSMLLLSFIKLKARLTFQFKFKSLCDDFDDKEAGYKMKVIKGKTEDLFAIKSILIENIQVFAIRPKALFLFQRVQQLTVKTRYSQKLSHICTMLKVLEIQMNKTSTKQSIKLHMSVRLSQDSYGLGCTANHSHIFKNLKRLDMYKIKSLELFFPAGFRGKLDAQSFADLDNLEELEELRFFNLSVNVIHPETFARFRNLKKRLALINMNISEIKAGAFRGLSLLERLNLTQNNLVRIGRGFFDGLHNLRQLEVTSNKIYQMEPGALSSLINLTHLEMSFNPMGYLELLQFEGLTSLKELQVYCTRFKDLSLFAKKVRTQLPDPAACSIFNGNNLI